MGEFVSPRRMMVTRMVPPARRDPPPLPADLPCAQLESRRVICGKVARRANHSKPVQTSRQKYFAFVVGQINGLTPPVSPDERGVAHVTNARWDAVDAKGARDGRALCVRRSRVVLMSRCWHQAQERRKFLTGDGGKTAVLRGEHDISRKAIAQGRPGCSCRTCMLVCAFAMCIGTRDRGCGVHPVFPAPSFQWRATRRSSLG